MESINMLNSRRENVYVAELTVPTCFYPSSEIRRAICNPGRFGLSRGYYKIRPPDEQSTVTGYAELVLVIQFLSQGLKEAEDQASEVGTLFGSLASAYGGYPLESPYLSRIARIDINNHLKSQHSYLYRPKPYTLSTFDHGTRYQFDQYIESFSSDAATRHQLQAAIHWYGICVSAGDPMVSYVAAWTGLESIGTIIHQMAHPNGQRAHCKTCGNISGEDRDRKKAGIDHMFNSLTNGPLSASLSQEARQSLDKDFLGSLSSKDAGNLRNSIVHGLDDVEAIVQQSSRSWRFLAHVLNASIQTVMGKSVKSLMPGDYEFHPDARYSCRFKEGLIRSPYHGEWGAKLRAEIELNTQPPDRCYIGSIEVELAIHDSAVEFVEFTSEDLFKRDADVYDVGKQSFVTGLPTWNSRPAEPAWKEWVGLENNY